jgi:hypothetical protein
MSRGARSTEHTALFGNVFEWNVVASSALPPYKRQIVFLLTMGHRQRERDS